MSAELVGALVAPGPAGARASCGESVPVAPAEVLAEALGVGWLTTRHWEAWVNDVAKFVTELDMAVTAWTSSSCCQLTSDTRV